MWISKKKWEALEKRVADLEKQIQGQQVQKDAENAVCKTKQLLGFGK